MTVSGIDPGFRAWRQMLCARRWRVLALLSMLTLTACSGGSDSSTAAPLPVPPPPSTSESTVIVGKATYARVPHDPFTNGLLYAFAYNAPIRGAVVELVADDGTTLDASTTSSEGDFRLTAGRQQRVAVRVRAQLRAEGSASWDMKVVDNTRGKALYTLTSETFTAEGETMIRDLFAPSGWTGNDYTEPRAAAPFAILDTVYTSMQQVLSVTPTIDFPELELNWSELNRPTVGALADGEIGNSLFRPSGGGREIYIMGAANADTDEYDEHIIAHEFTHYLHYHFGRTDSLGGEHLIGDRLDPRVAFGEGVASAFAAMMLKDANYIDTLGIGQAGGVSTNLETNTLRNPGWYSEGSVQAIIYDLYDARIDEVDTVELGFAPLYETLIGPLRAAVPFVTLHAYLDAVKRRHPDIAPAIDQIAAIQDVRTTDSDAYGAGETNSAARFDSVLPIYADLPLDGSAVRVCTIAGPYAFGVNNKLGNRRFLKFTINEARPNSATIITAHGPPGSDPDMILHRVGKVQSALTPAEPTERLRRIFTLGDYVLEIYDYANTTNEPFGDVCFDLSVTME